MESHTIRLKEPLIIPKELDDNFLFMVDSSLVQLWPQMAKVNVEVTGSSGVIRYTAYETRGKTCLRACSWDEQKNARPRMRSRMGKGGSA